MNNYFCKSRKFSVTVIMLVIAMFAATSLIPANWSYAAINYGDLNTRIQINENKYAEANEMDAVALDRYRDMFLADMYETNEKGMTVKQEAVVKAKADEIIEDAAMEKGGELTQYEMMRAFHDWIIEHFYFYQDVKKLSKDCDNPYYMLTAEYSKGKGKIRSRCNGYSTMFIAFVRSQGIIARAVNGHYIPATRKEPNNSEWKKIKTLTQNHQWAEAYVDRNGDGKKEWIMVDCNADCWNRYTPQKGYIEEGQFYDKNVYDAVRCAYFDVTAERLAQSHVIMSYRSGSKDLQYISCEIAKKKLKAFLNITHSGKKNGKRINKAYDGEHVETWFAANDSQSKGDGNGHLYKLYWPKNVGLYGKLDLSGFKSLQNFNVTNNQLTSLTLKNCPSLTTVSASQNKLTTVDTRGSKNVTLVSVQGNPATMVAYTFNKSKTAIIKTNNKGGTVSVKYSKTGSKHQHTMTAFPKSGYKFQGWYQGNKKISSKTKLVKTNTTTFTYVAKFKKK